jgi:hypothetical protein
VALSTARTSGRSAEGCGNEELATVSSGCSAQQRLLENELKLTDWTGRAGEGGLQVLNGLEKRIAVGTVGRSLSTAEADADDVESTAEAPEQVIQRLQGQGQLKVVRGGPN